MKEKQVRIRYECGAPLAVVPKAPTSRRKKGMITLNCLCGSSYRIERPQGDFIYPCRTCGRVLLQARVGTLNLKGVNTFGDQA